MISEELSAAPLQPDRAVCLTAEARPPWAHFAISKSRMRNSNFVAGVALGLGVVSLWTAEPVRAETRLAKPGGY